MLDHLVLFSYHEVTIKHGHYSLNFKVPLKFQQRLLTSHTNFLKHFRSNLLCMLHCKLESVVAHITSILQVGVT